MRNDARRHCEEHKAKSGMPDFEKCDEAIQSLLRLWTASLRSQ